MANFALLGVSGIVAPRHLEAIRATDNELIVAVDPHDSVGILDRCYSEILAGRGLGVDEVRPALELAAEIREMLASNPDHDQPAVTRSE